MTRFQNFDEIYSALFVDFDNIYTRLFEQDPALARTFATNPQRWMRWLEGHALRMMYGDGVRRRILKRCCYLNPIRYHEFRPFFIRSAFQVVDCPPLTNYGKTSADIHLVMDCMDALAHVTRFDEIIILSGDADFTPLLLRIQEHARRTLVLSVGYTSPAYAAACSWRIREDWFVAQALEEGDEREERGNGHHQYDERPQRRPDSDNGRPNDPASRPRATAPSNGISLNLPVYKRIKLVESIKQLVAESSVPVPLPSVAQVLQREQDAPSDWFGAGTLRELLDELELDPVVFSSVDQGYVYDPDRHDHPEMEDLRDEFRTRHPDLYEMAAKVNRLTDIPLLSPEQYGLLFKLLSDEITNHGYTRSGTVRHVEALCEDEGVPVTAAQIGFILDAAVRGGLKLAAGPRNSISVTPDQLRQAFSKNAEELCKLSQLSFDDNGIDLLSEWLEHAPAA